jgi:hypothetical protein
MRVSSSQACQFCVFIVFLGWATPCHGSSMSNSWLLRSMHIVSVVGHSNDLEC